MGWIEPRAELARLAGLVVVEKLIAVFQVSKDQVADVIVK